MVRDLPIKSQKLVKVGHSYYFTIPAAYVSNGAVNPKKKYDLQIGKVGIKGVKIVRVDDGKYLRHYLPVDKAKYIDTKKVKRDREYNIILNEATIKKQKK